MSNLLRSRAGVEQVDNPYENLQKGIIKVKAQKDKRIDLGQLVSLLEKEVGFEPVTEVTLEMQWNLVQREGKVFFEVSETGQTFMVEKAEGARDVPPEKKPLAAVAVLADPHVADRIVLRQSNPAKTPEQQKAAAAEKAREVPKNVEIVPGMTKEDIIKALGGPLKTIAFGQKTILKYEDLTIELQDNKVTNVKTTLPGPP
jgi:hypothetical protein